MRTILFIAFIALVAMSCFNTVQPASTETNPLVPEPNGSPPNSEQQGAAFSIATEAYYQASIHSTSSPGKVISLRLTPKHRAEMVIDNLDSKPPLLDTCEWTTLNNGNLLLDLHRVGSSDSSKLEFKTDGDKLVYTGKEYGSAGLVLTVKPIPIQ